ncbi:hypothetical protein NMY22_g12596 [Coprinellus aureogranulatus]|nr:hypothetical protein NMY22_g12596 [Coprinellus aureogranulatus]
MQELLRHIISLTYLEVGSQDARYPACVLEKSTSSLIASMRPLTSSWSVLRRNFTASAHATDVELALNAFMSPAEVPSACACLHHDIPTATVHPDAESGTRTPPFGFQHATISTYCRFQLAQVSCQGLTQPRHSTRYPAIRNKHGVAAALDECNVAIAGHSTSPTHSPSFLESMLEANYSAAHHPSVPVLKAQEERTVSLSSKPASSTHFPDLSVSLPPTTTKSLLTSPSPLPLTSMRFSTVAISLLLSATSVVYAQPSPIPRAICYTCPDQDNGGVLLVDAPNMGSDPFACVYGDAGTCHYSIDGSLLIDDNTNGCPVDAFNLCLHRRRQARERAPP